MLQPIYETDWYRACVEECAAILTEKGEQTKIAILELHYLIGKRVLEDSLHWERAKYGEKIIENLACDIFLNIANKQSAARRLWECIAFVRRFPELCDASHNLDPMKLPAVEGTRLPGWRYVVQNLLSEGRKCAHEFAEENVVIMKCKLCGKRK